MRCRSIKNKLKDCTLVDYLKSVYVNKYTLTGYMSAAACVGLSCVGDATSGDASEMFEMFIIGLSKGITGIYAFLSLGQTALGLTTLISYKRTKNHLEQYHSLPKEFSKLNEHYCDEVGMELAIKESRLERMIDG